MASHFISLGQIDHPSLSNLISIPAVVILLSVWMISKVIYNVYFHPLRSYPGPFLGSVSSFYICYLELSGAQHIKIKEFHDTYGEVVRIGPNQLSYISNQAWQDIYGHRSGSHKALFEKDEKFWVSAPNGLPSIIAATGDHHRRLRRLLNHAFSEKALRAQESLIKGHIDQFITQLKNRESTGNIVNIVHWFNFSTFDTIGDLAFGESLDMLKEGVWTGYLSSMFSFVYFTTIQRAVRCLFPLTWKYWLNIFTPKEIMDNRLYAYTVAKEKLTHRLSNDTERLDFVHYMMKGSQKAIGDDGLTFEEMVTQSNALMIAGSETTATLLSEEIRTSFSEESEISMQTTSHLPYLQAVIEESLRMYPPVPNMLPRITPWPGENICGKFVPGGTRVAVHHYASYHSSKNFFEPESFHPERWLDSGDSRFANDNKDVLHPFSLGPRNCIGMNLAYSEMRLTTSKLFWNFDIELQPESRQWEKQGSGLLWKKDPLYIKLRLRK